MEVGITLTKLNEKILATVKEVDGERYFCLAEILEQLHLKAALTKKVFLWKFQEKLFIVSELRTA